MSELKIKTLTCKILYQHNISKQYSKTKTTIIVDITVVMYYINKLW